MIRRETTAQIIGLVRFEPTLSNNGSVEERNL